MTNDEQNALRALLREEVNAAVYASEQRMGERMDKRFNQLEGHMDRLEAGHRELRADFARIDVKLSEAISVLGDATRVINELRVSQYALESKVEDALLGLRRDMQALDERVHTFSRHFLTLSQTIDERITRHERMRIDETHPYPPHSAA